MTVIYRTGEEGDSNYFELIKNNEFYLILRVHEKEVRLYFASKSVKNLKANDTGFHSWLYCCC